MNKKSCKIQIKVITGLHIGTGNDAVQIGGVDSTVIKDPHSQLPYIPGSSIKGKIRCLLETEGEYKENNDTINKYFGPTSEYLKKKEIGNTYKQTPTRLIFQDIFLSNDDKNKYLKGEWNTEFKTEIVIDRSKGTAKDGGLRTIERVPPQTTFEGKILIRYEHEEIEDIQLVLRKGINLLNNDYLGGSGSRGYGAVEVTLE